MKKRLLVGLAAAAIVVLVALVAVPHVLPWALSHYRPDIRFRVTTAEKRIFITIDDAPSKNTSEILRVLNAHGVPATFFVIANRVSSPGQLEEIVAARQSLGNHLRTTKACSRLSLAEFRADFDACAALVERPGRPRLFRPASDFGTREQIAYARSKGYEAVMGTVFPLDTRISDPDWLVRISGWLAVPGGIVILHDGDVRGQTTARVLDRLLPKLKAEGFVFGRLEEALNESGDLTHSAGTAAAAQSRGRPILVRMSRTRAVCLPRSLVRSTSGSSQEWATRHRWFSSRANGRRMSGNSWGRDNSGREGRAALEYPSTSICPTHSTICRGVPPIDRGSP